MSGEVTPKAAELLACIKKARDMAAPPPVRTALDALESAFPANVERRHVLAEVSAHLTAAARAAAVLTVIDRGEM